MSTCRRGCGTAHLGSSTCHRAGITAGANAWAAAVVERAASREAEVEHDMDGHEVTLPQIITADSPWYRTLLQMAHARTCQCPPNHLNCLTPKEWVKSQLGVWQVHYSGNDVRNKAIHPATFPLALAKRVIALFTHAGELVLDPFVGSGTTLLAAQALQRQAVGFDLQEKYIRLCAERLATHQRCSRTRQLAIHDNAWHIPQYIAPETIRLIWTSPPYANLLNRQRQNKSRRGLARKNGQFGKVEQYSQDPHDLGTMPLAEYTRTIGDIFARLLPLLQPKAHCVINVPDMWWDNARITIHIALVEELCRRGYELRNTIIWDRTNVVNRIGIFGWPSNYITMGTTFEYLLDFWRPAAAPAVPAPPGDPGHGARRLPPARDQRGSRRPGGAGA
jgi:DNA modification methylase